MKRRAILVVLVAVLVSPLPADLSVSFGSRQAALVVQDTRFPVAIQLLSGLEAGMAVGGPTLTVDLHVALESAKGSMPTGGTLYRGVVHRTVALGASWQLSSGIGVRASGTGTLASYQTTRLLFFFPAVELAPWLRLPVGSSADLEWSLPVAYHARPDLTVAAVIGLRARLLVSIQEP